jgi:hypothetical protein
MPNFNLKNPLVAAELFHADGEADGRRGRRTERQAKSSLFGNRRTRLRRLVGISFQIYTFDRRHTWRLLLRKFSDPDCEYKIQLESLKLDQKQNTCSKKLNKRYYKAQEKFGLTFLIRALAYVQSCQFVVAAGQ